jgi:hypothetical protein
VTCITPLDLHDLARSCLTYGVKRYYIVNPLASQREFAERISNFWLSHAGASYNMTRAEAFELARIRGNVGEVIEEIRKEEGKPPEIIATSAKAENGITFKALRKKIGKGGVYLILLGTGWGLQSSVLDSADHLLEPIDGAGKYNHLSVRSAGAIILDRLLGDQ